MTPCFYPHSDSFPTNGQAFDSYATQDHALVFRRLFAREARLFQSKSGPNAAVFDRNSRGANAPGGGGAMTEEVF